MLASTACCLPTRCYLGRGSKRWNSLGPMLATGFQLVMVWKAGRVWTTFPCVPALCLVISTSFDPLSIRWLQMICKICSSEAGCQFLAADTWHQCLLCQGASLGGTVLHASMWMVTVRSDVYHLLPHIPRIHENQKKVHGNRFLVTFFMLTLLYIVVHIPVFLACIYVLD